MGPSVKIDDREVSLGFRRMLSTAENPRAMLSAMGRYGASSTRLRFRTQTDPAGKRWKPSRRALKQSGQTLSDTRRLRNSISWQVTPQAVEWGTNVVYAGSHQSGVDERQKVKAHYRVGRAGRTTRSGAKIRFLVRSHERHMVIEARAFLGINDADRQALWKIARDEFLKPLARQL